MEKGPIYVKLIHEKSRDGGKTSKIERSMLFSVAEKALRDSEVKAHLNWKLHPKSPYEFKGGVLVEKKAQA